MSWDSRGGVFKRALPSLILILLFCTPKYPELQGWIEGKYKEVKEGHFKGKRWVLREETPQIAKFKKEIKKYETEIRTLLESKFGYELKSGKFLYCGKIKKGYIIKYLFPMKKEHKLFVGIGVEFIVDSSFSHIKEIYTEEVPYE